MRLVRTFEPEPACLAFICAYELGGLVGLWPTWTARVRPLGRWARVAVSLSASTYLFLHLVRREIRSRDA